MLDSMILEVSILYSIGYYNTLHLVFIGVITLSDTIEFTSIDEDSTPQFTFTCISTGGPATTVTWTRDSVTITAVTETTLDNNITAQYTHTLTVTGRLGGLYTCTVANNETSIDTNSSPITLTSLEPLNEYEISVVGLSEHFSSEPITSSIFLGQYVYV